MCAFFTFFLHIHAMGKSTSMNFNESHNVNGTVNTYLNRTTIQFHSEVICSWDNTNSLCTKSSNWTVIKADCRSFCNWFATLVQLMHVASISLISSWKTIRSHQNRCWLLFMDKMFFVRSISPANSICICHHRTVFLFVCLLVRTINFSVHFETLCTFTILFPLSSLHTK